MPVGCLVVIVWWDACIGWASPQPVCGLNLANSCSSWSAQNIRNCYQKCYQKSEINGNLPTPDDQGGWFPFVHFNCQILCLCFSANRFLSVKKRQFSQNSVVLDQNNEWEKQCKIDNIHINSTSLTCEKLAELEMFVFQEPCPGWGQVEPDEK